MKPIAIFYHCWLGEQDQGVNIVAEQMVSLNDSGLAEAASPLFICGGAGDVLLASAMCPRNTTLHSFGGRTNSELPTLAFLQEWIKDFPDAMVLYFHTKGASLAGDPYAKWRRCMERVVITRWRECVDLLQRGSDTVGAHWMTHQKYSIIAKEHRYWGGNFWWATAKYLSTLPTVPIKGRYEAEIWIGRTQLKIKSVDLASHWPQQGCI